jgi:hypothetical protein
MHTYDVQSGESPAQIAIKFAGCPKCAIDLVHANPHKPTVTFPNGFTTFRSLRAGETLALPEKWLNGDLESRPPAYFAALPYADGVTPSMLGDGAAGVLGDYAALDAASARVGALASMDDPSFSRAVGDVGALIDSAVQEAYGSANQTAAARAGDVQNGTKWAWQRNADLAAALAAGNSVAATQARLDIQNALSTAIGNARLALQAFYGGSGGPPISAAPPAGASFPATVSTAAQAAAAAIAADASYCGSVARAGTAVNAAVHNFKAAWNASQSPPVPINTGNYEQPTAAAMTRVLGTAPAACGAHALPPPPPPPPPVARTCPAGSIYDASSGRCVLPQIAAPAQGAKTGGLSTGAVVGIALGGAAVVGGAAYLASRPPARGRRRRAHP